APRSRRPGGAGSSAGFYSKRCPDGPAGASMVDSGAGIMIAAEQDLPVARVNGRTIGRRLLRMVLAQAREQYTRTGKPVTPEVEQEIEREAVEQLIGRELLFEESQRRCCMADEEEVERQISELADQAGGMLALTVML